MANPSHPDDPYRVPNDPYRTPLADDDVRRQAPLDQARLDQVRLDNELQVDPELAGGRSSGGRIAMLAVAIAVIVGAALYGLNNSAIHQAGTSSTAQTAAQDSPPAAPPGMRDVTPRPNTQPGMTTGAAPANPQPPPATTNSGATNSNSTR
jgi:hypothetical protein